MCLLDLRLPFPAINHQVNEPAKCHCNNKSAFLSQATAHTPKKISLKQVALICLISP